MTNFATPSKCKHNDKLSWPGFFSYVKDRHGVGSVTAVSLPNYFSKVLTILLFIISWKIKTVPIFKIMSAAKCVWQKRDLLFFPDLYYV